MITAVLTKIKFNAKILIAETEPTCDWTEWTKCSASCCGGFESRDELCTIQGQSVKNSSERRACNTQPCFSWSHWTPESPCTVTCGEGKG